MRALLASVFVAACAAEPPQAPLAGEPSLAEMTYTCTPEGNLIVRWDFPEGGFQESMTGEACDYEAWRADVETYGPVRTRERSDYSRWREGEV